MKRALRGLIALAALMILGCSSCRESQILSSPPEPSPTLSEISGLPMVEAAVLQTNKDLWESKGIKDYDFVIHHMRIDMMPSPTFKISVRDGKVRSFRSIDGKEVPHIEVFTLLDTIEELFGIVTTSPGDDREIFASFDPDFGYPIKIETRGKQMHSNFRWEVLEFTPKAKKS